MYVRIFSDLLLLFHDIFSILIFWTVCICYKFTLSLCISVCIHIWIARISENMPQMKKIFVQKAREEKGGKMTQQLERFACMFWIKPKRTTTKTTKQMNTHSSDDTVEKDNANLHREPVVGNGCYFCVLYSLCLFWIFFICALWMNWEFAA